MRSDIPDPHKFLSASFVVDYDNREVLQLAQDLAKDSEDPVPIARQCFHFVRDRIRHSADYRENPVTLRASEVLAYGTGLCYAKCHLLVALLRANAIPSGFCYQRLQSDMTENPSFILHGLAAVYLTGYGWYRIDPRGDTPEIVTRFDPPHEFLAFTPKYPGEADLPGIFPEPLPEITDLLAQFRDYRDVLAHLPDRKPE